MVVGAVWFLTVACGSTTTTTTEPTAAPTTAAAVDTSTAVFPPAASAVRYSDPVAAATAFATDYAGFVNPVVGSFQQGDSRSGEVEVRPRAQGPVTTVIVRQLGPDASWWVLGAATANITLTDPATQASITSPVTLKGTSTAFEGTVQTQVREDGNNKPLGQGYVTGGSMGQMGPFDGSLAFTQPTQSYGAVMLSTVSAQDGNVAEVTVIRVRLVP